MSDPASAPLFDGMDKLEVGKVLTAAVRQKFKASETIIQAERPSTHLILVRSGSVNFYIVTEGGREVLLRRFVPGNAFGISTFLSKPVGYLGTATAVREVEILAWDHRTVRQLARAYPRLAENALRIALHYIAVYAQRHLSLVSDTAQERLALALTGLGSRAGHFLPGGVEVDVKNEDLASLADLSLFTASRLLTKWQRAGAIEKSRGKVLIRCPEKLLADESREMQRPA